MIRKSKLFLITLTLLVLFIITTNYFMSVLTYSESEVKSTQEETLEQKILLRLKDLPERYKKRRELNDNYAGTFMRNLKLVNKVEKIEEIWKKANSWVSKTQLYDANDPLLGTVANAMKYAKIIQADYDARGTQLKLLLTLEGGQTAVFKPKWYSKNKVIEGPVYSGKDRYGSEILAFYLSAILNKPLTPIAVERQISLKKDIVPVATKRLLSTIFDRNNATCVFGKCFYCKKEDPVCEDESKTLTGAVLFNIQAELKSARSPWQRTYKKRRKAEWETNSNYCRIVKTKLTKRRILDLIDTAIFDFLMQNGDRHHYETLDDKVILLDNGKGLGNPHIHHIDILAPLYQCCMLKSSTWQKLEDISGGVLRETLASMPEINNFVAGKHLTAMEERLLIIFASVEYCRKSYNTPTV